MGTENEDQTIAWYLDMVNGSVQVDLSSLFCTRSRMEPGTLGSGFFVRVASHGCAAKFDGYVPR
jgi:hypothetical protein